MSRRPHRSRRSHGFTLIELLTAIVVSTLVVAVALSLYLTITASLRRQVASRREEALQALDVVRRDLACALPTSVTSSPPFALVVDAGALGASSNSDLTLTTATLDAPETPLAQMQVWRVRYRLVATETPEADAMLVREAVRLDAQSYAKASATNTLFRGAASFQVNVLAGTAWAGCWTPTASQPVPGAANVQLGWHGAWTTETATAWTVIPAALTLPGPSHQPANAPPAAPPGP